MFKFEARKLTLIKKISNRVLGENVPKCTKSVLLSILKYIAGIVVNIRPAIHETLRVIGTCLFYFTKIWQDF